jgi:hypothetical protein
MRFLMIRPPRTPGPLTTIALPTTSAANLAGDPSFHRLEPASANGSHTLTAAACPARACAVERCGVRTKPLARRTLRISLARSTA